MVDFDHVQPRLGVLYSTWMSDRQGHGFEPRPETFFFIIIFFFLSPLYYFETIFVFLTDQFSICSTLFQISFLFFNYIGLSLPYLAYEH
jgi:hypothetical protein